MSIHTRFTKMLTTDSQYGIIWEGVHQNTPCVIKMIMLRTGCHYNQDKETYVDATGKYKKKKQIQKFFTVDQEAPLLHSRFAQRKSMTLDDFRYEVTSLQHLASLKLGPQVLECWIRRGQSVPIHYGFVAMEKGDCSLKDLIVGQKWNEKDRPIISNLISSLHKEGLIHGDLKPSNIIVWLDPRDRIQRALFIDAQKLLRKEETKNFTKLVKKDQKHFQEHVDKNVKEIV
jgi:serine/threonine protein kinase